MVSNCFPNLEEFSIDSITKEETKKFENLKFFKGNILLHNHYFNKFFPNCKYYDDGKLMIEESDEYQNEKDILKKAKKIKIRNSDKIPDV
jgi:hypothetical protein